jgi:hypothetical protein
MRDQIKKPEDELLVVHKPSPAAVKMGDAVSPETQMLPANVDRLAAQLLASSDESERTRLLAMIQNRFGNAFAARVIDRVRRGPAGPAPESADDEPTGGLHQ